MTNPSEDHAAREAEIRADERQRIIRELEAQVESWIHSATWFPASFRETTAIDGLREAISIIERGGAQPEGER